MTKEMVTHIIQNIETLSKASDSGIEDFVEAHAEEGVTFDDVTIVLANLLADKLAQWKTCKFCKHINRRLYIVQPNDPCYTCTRRVVLSDRYEKDNDTETAMQNYRTNA